MKKASMPRFPPFGGGDRGSNPPIFHARKLPLPLCAHGKGKIISAVQNRLIASDKSYFASATLWGACVEKVSYEAKDRNPILLVESNFFLMLCNAPHCKIPNAQEQ